MNRGGRYAPPKIVPRTKRPVDKQLIVVNHTTTTGGVSTTLYTCTYPGTITGIRWSLSHHVVQDTAGTEGMWFIVVIRDGYAANAASLTSGSSLYQPESDVLAFGAFSGSRDTSGTDSGVIQDGSTKTMRKLQAGDVMLFVSIANVDSNIDLFGAVQFFIKT